VKVVRNNIVVALAGILIVAGIPLMTCTTVDDVVLRYDHGNRLLNDNNYQPAIRCLEDEPTIGETIAIDYPDAEFVEYIELEPLHFNVSVSTGHQP